MDMFCSDICFTTDTTETEDFAITGINNIFNYIKTEIRYFNL